MSHTDKTDPPLLQVTNWSVEHHQRCRDSGGTKYGYLPCDLPTDTPKRYAQRSKSRCTWEPDISYYRYPGSKMWSREGRLAEDGNLYERHLRTQWRNTRRKLLQTSPDLIDDIELPDPRHRHVVLWWRW